MFPEYENVRCRDPSTFPMECSNSTALHGMEQSLMSALERTKVSGRSLVVCDCAAVYVRVQS